MARLISLMICGFALAFVSSATFATNAEAKPKNMLCKATGLDGKQSKWKCSASQKCCYDWLSGKGTCVSASGICL